MLHPFSALIAPSDMTHSSHAIRARMPQTIGTIGIDSAMPESVVEMTFVVIQISGWMEMPVREVCVPASAHDIILRFHATLPALEDVM